MSAQGNKPEPAGFMGRPERTATPAPEPLAGRAEGLGLDDLTDDEQAAVCSDTLSGEGGLGFDDLTDVERQRLAETGPVDGGLGLDDAMVDPGEEEDYRAA